MIKVEIPFSADSGKIYDLIYLGYFSTYEDNRPTFKWANHYYCLDDRLHFWLKENNIEYSLIEKNDTCYIVFESKKDAMLFKLTFGGQ